MKPRLLLDLGNTRLKWALALPPDAGPPQWRLGDVTALAHAGPDFLPALEQALRGLPELDSVHLVAVTAETTVDAIQRCVDGSVRVQRSARHPRAARRSVRARYAASARPGSRRTGRRGCSRTASSCGS